MRRSRNLYAPGYVQTTLNSVNCCRPPSADPPSDHLDLIGDEDDEITPPPYSTGRRGSLNRSSYYLQTPKNLRGRSASSHSTTSTESGPQPSPIWHHNLNFNGLTSDFDRSRSMVNISKKPMEDDEDEISPRSGRSSTQSTLRYTNSLKNTSTSSIRGSVNSHVLEEKAPPRIPKTLNDAQFKLYLAKRETEKSPVLPNADATSIRSTESRASFNASLSSGSPSSSSMGQRPDTSMSRQSRVVAVKPKTSVSSMGADRRSVSSAPKVRPDSEQSVMKEDEAIDVPSFVQCLVWKLTEFVFIGNESVATNAHVLCRMNIKTTVELYDGPELEDNRRTFDNTCFCDKKSHARSQFKLKVPDNEHDATEMAKNKVNGEQYNLTSMMRVFCELVADEVKHQKRVLVFSRRGRNRAPAFCIAYLMFLEKIPRRDAQLIVEQRMDTMRPKIQIEAYLIRALLKWQQKLDVNEEQPAALYTSTRDLFSRQNVDVNAGGVANRRASAERIPPRQAW